MSHTDGNYQIFPGGQALYDVSLTLPPLSVFTDVSLTAQVDNPFTPLLGVCDIHPSDACTHGYPQYTRNYLNTDYNDKVKLRVGTLMNKDSSPVTVVFTVSVVLLTTQLSPGDAVNTSISMSYNGNDVGLGSIESTYTPGYIPFMEVICSYSLTYHMNYHIIYHMIYHMTYHMAYHMIYHDLSHDVHVSHALSHYLAHGLSHDVSHDLSHDISHDLSYNMPSAYEFSVHVTQMLLEGFCKFNCFLE